MFGFLWIVKQKKISEWSENFWKFENLLHKKCLKGGISIDADSKGIFEINNLPPLNFFKTAFRTPHFYSNWLWPYCGPHETLGHNVFFFYLKISVYIFKNQLSLWWILSGFCFVSMLSKILQMIFFHQNWHHSSFSYYLIHLGMHLY